MKRLLLILCIISNVITSLACMAQEDDHEDGSGSHVHMNNEIGGAIGIFFDMKDQHSTSGFHLHYTRMYRGKLEHFGIAPGVEFLFGEHRHYAAHLMLVFQPAHGCWIGAGPGITYVEHRDEFEFSGHIETGYAFDAGTVHFGPVVEYSWAKDDQHFMLGLHLGVPF